VTSRVKTVGGSEWPASRSGRGKERMVLSGSRRYSGCCGNEKRPEVSV
jgi:hypothetical protein